MLENEIYFHVVCQEKLILKAPKKETTKFMYAKFQNKKRFNQDILRMQSLDDEQCRSR